MSNEQQELLDEVYKNYVKWWEYDDNSVNLSDKESEKWLKLVDGGLQWAPLIKEQFINKCKTDSEFSEKWGLKIEERELSLDERMKILINKGTGWNMIEFINRGHEYMNEENIPTRLITLTYNNETIESYES